MARRDRWGLDREEPLELDLELALPGFVRNRREFRGGGGAGGSGRANQVQAVSTKTANYTATSSDEVLLVDATAGSVVVTLPPAASSSKLRLTVKKLDSTVNTVTIDGNAAETIDGATTLVIASQYTSYTLVCDGASWHVI